MLFFILRNNLHTEFRILCKKTVSQILMVKTKPLQYDIQKYINNPAHLQIQCPVQEFKRHEKPTSS